MRRSHKAAGLALLLALPFACCALERTELMPSRESPHLQIANLSCFIKSLDRLALDELRKDKRFQDFSATMTAKLKKLEVDGKLPLVPFLLYEQLPALKGEVVLSLGNPADQSHNRGCYLAAAMTAEDYRKDQDRIKWSIDSSHAPIESVKTVFQNQEITRFVAHAGATNEESCWKTCLNGTLLFSSDHQWIERNIIQLQKGPATEPKETADIHLYLPIGSWMRTAIEQENNAKKRTAAEQLGRALGLYDLGVLTIDIAAIESGMAIDFNLVADNLNKGLLTLIDPNPAIPPKEGLIPANATSFSTGRINLPRLWANLPSILADAAPDTATQMNNYLAAFRQTTGTDLTQDFINHIGTSYCSYSMPDGTNQFCALALQMNDGRAFKAAFERMLAAPGVRRMNVAVQTMDFHGHTLYWFSTKPITDRSYTMCITDNQLLLGDFDALRESLLAMDQAQPVQAGRLMRNAAGYIPPDAFLYGATDHRKTVALVSAMISDSQFSFNAALNPDSSNPKNSEHLGNNEISLNYLGSFLHNTYYFTEKTKRGIHHRIVLKQANAEESNEAH